MSRSLSLGAACALVLLCAAQAPALETSGPTTLEAAAHPMPVSPPAIARPIAATPGGFRTVKDALRAGVRDYNAGDKEGAARALEYAALQGHTLALWKLGRMYAEGDGVPHDDLKAFEYFSKVADESTDEGDAGNTGVLSSAFVALGTYLLDGIQGTYVTANLERAVELFHYAASYFGDPNAQYSLARLYLEGHGVSQDARQAARWFNLAAEKGHVPSQALLGQLLTTGQGVPAERAKGLMWLTVAREGADLKKDTWIQRLQDEAFASSSEAERQEAAGYLQSRIRRKR
jgi:TPR repeat protein